MKKALFLLIFLTSYAHGLSDHLYNRQVLKQKERFKLSDVVFGKSKPLRVLSINKGGDWLENRVYIATVQSEQNQTQSFSPLEETNFFYGGFLYLWVLGIEYDHYDWDAFEVDKFKAHLRLLGSSQQDSRFNIFVGKYQLDERTSNRGEFDNTTFGVEATLYLANQIGINSTFEKITSETNESGNILEGQEIRYEVFAEYGAFRVFYRFTKEELEFSAVSTAQEKVERESSLIGFAFYF